MDTPSESIRPLTVEETMAILRVSRSTLYRLVDRKELRDTKSQGGGCSIAVTCKPSSSESVTRRIGRDRSYQRRSRTREDNRALVGWRIVKRR